MILPVKILAAIAIVFLVLTQPSFSRSDLINEVKFKVGKVSKQDKIKIETELIDACGVVDSYVKLNTNEILIMFNPKYTDKEDLKITLNSLGFEIIIDDLDELSEKPSNDNSPATKTES